MIYKVNSIINGLPLWFSSQDKYLKYMDLCLKHLRNKLVKLGSDLDPCEE